MTNTSIVICGQKFNIGKRVILWDEPNGLNAYDQSKYVIKTQDRKSGKTIKNVISGKRYSSRASFMNMDKLRSIVTQFFIHHSGMYRSRDTFQVLHNERKLSVHFILDDDGTLYQTLDLVEKAWHGGANNTMSVGIEIDSRAHANRFPFAYDEAHCKKYGVIPHKKRIDHVQDMWIVGYQYTEAQYATLISLAMVLTRFFPQITPDFPRDSTGRIVKYALPISLAKSHKGLICHYNNSATKNDAICLDHYRLIGGIKTRNPYYSSTFLDLSDWRKRQYWLNAVGFNPGPIDGEFGLMTKRALEHFQDSVHLTVDGIWGPKSEYMLDLATKEKGLK